MKTRRQILNGVAQRADTLVHVSAFQAFGNYTSAFRGLAAPASDVSALPGLNYRSRKTNGSEFDILADSFA